MNGKWVCGKCGKGLLVEDEDFDDMQVHHCFHCISSIKTYKTGPITLNEFLGEDEE